MFSGMFCKCLMDLKSILLLGRISLTVEFYWSLFLSWDEKYKVTIQTFFLTGVRLCFTIWTYLLKVSIMQFWIISCNSALISHILFISRYSYHNSEFLSHNSWMYILQFRVYILQFCMYIMQFWLFCTILCLYLTMSLYFSIQFISCNWDFYFSQFWIARKKIYYPEETSFHRLHHWNEKKNWYCALRKLN